MSWLREGLGKVRELGAEISSRLVPVLPPRQGSSLVAAAKQVGWPGKDRSEGAAQLEAQALAAVDAGPAAVEQLCQAWRVGGGRMRARPGAGS